MSASSNVKATAVIVGGTGWLGSQISKIFLTEYRAAFPTVRVTTRDPKSDKSLQLAALGAELVAFDAPLSDTFAGADVIINTLTGRIPEDDKKKLISAVAASNAKVYFLGEFGADYNVIGFPGYEHPEWAGKKELASLARESFKGKTKAIAVYTGAFLDLLFTPFAALLGYDITKGAYSIVGPPSTASAWTSQVDIARAVARLSILALDPATAASVPETVRISGTNASAEDVADAVSRVRGVPKGPIESVSAESVRASLREASPADQAQRFLDYLKIAIGEGAMDFSTRNDNELVNPGQSLWKWQDIEGGLRAAS